MSDEPNRGEIWHLNWGRAETKEFALPHYAVCLSADNEGVDVALFCPLTSDKGISKGAYSILLPEQITGKKCWALLRHVKSLDWSAREGNFSGKCVPYDEMRLILRAFSDYMNLDSL